MGKQTTIGGAVLCLVGLCGLTVLRSPEPEVLLTAPLQESAGQGSAPAVASFAPIPAPPPASPQVETRGAGIAEPRALVRIGAGTEAREFLDPMWEAAVEAALPHLDVMVSVAGNRDVLDQLRQERVDLAAVRGELNWRERDAGLVEHPLGRERFVLVVQDGHQPWELGLEQVHSALTGKAATWRELGGATMPLRVVIPAEEGFLARAARALVPGDPLVDGALQVADEAAVLETVRRVPGSLGIVREPALSGTTGVRVVQVEGFGLSTHRRDAGSCLLGDRVLVVSHEATSSAGREVVAFLASPAGKALQAHRLLTD